LDPTGALKPRVADSYLYVLMPMQILQIAHLGA
jgi:hypothetical protein